MFSGKTEELIRRVKRALYGKQKVQVFKPKIDVRYDETQVVSHSRVKLTSTPIDRAEEIFHHLRPDTQVVGIDEVQFFGADVVPVVEALTDACGACLLLELWTGAMTGGSPTLRIRTPSADRLATTVAALADALRAMVTPAGELRVEVGAGGDASPPGMPPLLDPALAAHAGCLMIGLEVPPVFRSATGVYPLVLRALAGELARAATLQAVQAEPPEPRRGSLDGRFPAHAGQQQR
jgi:hypothetical protein